MSEPHAGGRAPAPAALADPGRAFADFVARHPECLEPASFDLLRTHNPLPLTWELQEWPVLLPPARSRAMAEASAALIEIARTLPRRIFADDPARIADYYTLAGGAVMAELALSEPNGIADAFYRGDYVETADGLKCIEINAGTGIAGWEGSSLAPLYLEVPLLRRFLDEHGLHLHCRHTSFEILRHAVEGVLCNPELDGEDEVNVRMVRSAHDELYRPEIADARRRTFADALQAAEPGLAGSFDFCRPSDLTFADGKVFHDGRRVHALIEQGAEPGPATRQVFSSFKGGQLDLYTGPATQIIMDKRNVALLSEHQDAPCFDAEEQRLLRRIVPWTRRVTRTFTDFRGERVFLPELLASAREQLVLKLGSSYTGLHVYFGAAATAAEWDARAAQALAEEGRWVVQERLVPVAYDLLDRGRAGAVPHDVIWGFFAFGGGFQGGFLRVMPRARAAVISRSNGARHLPFFEVEAGPLRDVWTR